MSSDDVRHGSVAPSPWVQRWTHLLSPGQTVLDIACGHGRHMAWFKQHGLRTTGIDRSEEALMAAGAFGRVVLADIEAGAWPLLSTQGPEGFDLVIVTNYLWRPLWTTILESVAPGGLLIYETFMQGNAAFGKPSNPAFLLQPGELLQQCGSMSVLAFEQGLLSEPSRCVQRILARRETTDSAAPMPHLDSLK